MYSDIRPAYISWADIDQDGYHDLVIWTPGLSHQVEGSEFVSGNDGEVHVMPIQLTRPLHHGFGIW
ncbi:MAG TPA: hypothetical protein DEF45_01545 [Rhodopirellula sp.]|nr:hypothetical protein [Rhodopirellula sp.]